MKSESCIKKFLTQMYEEISAQNKLEKCSTEMEATSSDQINIDRE